MENLSGFPFPAGKRRSPSKRRASMAPSQLAKSQHASEAKSNGSRGGGGGFGIFRFFFSGLSSSSSASSTNGKTRSSPLKNTSRRSPAGRNNRRKSMGEALFSAKEREKEEQAASMAAPPPPPPLAPAPPPPPFATPMAPPPPGSALRSKRGLPGQLDDGVTPNSRKKMRSLYWSVIPKVRRIRLASAFRFRTHPLTAPGQTAADPLVLPGGALQSFDQCQRYRARVPLLPLARQAQRRQVYSQVRDGCPSSLLWRTMSAE